MHLACNRSRAVRFAIVFAILMPAWSCAREDASGRGIAVDAVKTSIAWSVGEVNAVIGDGQRVVDDAVVEFTATADLQDVSIVATSGVAGILDISPAHLDTVTAGVPCGLRIKFTVTPDTAAGTYAGTIRVTSGHRKYARPLHAKVIVDFGGAAILPTTRVITQPTWDDLQYAAPDYSLIEFLTVTEELMFVQAGDVIVSGVTEQTPLGLIKKVVSVGSDDDTPLSLTCADATLADAFSSASLAITKALTPEDAAEGQDPIESGDGYGFFVRYADVLRDGDDDPGTVDDQVAIAGTIGFDTTFSFALEIGASAVQSGSFTGTTAHALDTTVDAQSGIAPFAKSVDLWSRQMKPLTVWVGWVPVVIVPALTLRANVEGDVAAPTHAAMTESASMTAGATYAGGAWQPVAEFNVASIEGAASPAPGCNVKARVGAGLDVLVYGVPAARTQPDGFLRTETGGIDDPWWRLHGGLEADAGVSANVLDGALAGAMFPEIIEDESLLAEGGGATPQDDGFIAGVVRDAATGVPLADVHAVAKLADATAAEGVTDALGAYTLTVPAADGYTVAFSKEGYLTAAYDNVSVATEQTTHLDALLEAEEIGTGIIAGVVQDAATGVPLADVHAIAMMAGSPEAEGDTAADGTFTLAVPQADGYAVIFSKEGYLPATYLDISVVAEHTTYIEAVLQIDAAYAGIGSIGGTIVNALTGVGVPGLTVDLREGLNATIGTVVATAPLPTDASGHYSIAGIPAGNYTACAWGDGYHNAYFSVICLGDALTDDQDGTITPILPAGQTRIVLTWGEVPQDLDSHLTGPLPDGTRFWLYYYYLYHTNPWALYVNLDHDDTTSFGPETTTILLQIDGVYRFTVHDFTNANATPLSPSYALSNSGVLVRVYRDEGLVAKFAVPPNRSGTLWAVFDMSGDAITPLNLVTYDSTVIHP